MREQGQGLGGHIGPVLKDTRLHKGLSQASLEESTGIPKARISRYENGHVEPSISSLARLATGLDTTTSQLIAWAELDLEESS